MGGVAACAVMFDKSHVEAWRKVTDGVHGVGGRILFQPCHPGVFLSLTLMLMFV